MTPEGPLTMPRHPARRDSRLKGRSFRRVWPVRPPLTREDLAAMLDRRDRAHEAARSARRAAHREDVAMYRSLRAEAQQELPEARWDYMWRLTPEFECGDGIGGEINGVSFAISLRPGGLRAWGLSGKIDCPLAGTMAELAAELRRQIARVQP